MIPARNASLKARGGHIYCAGRRKIYARFIYIGKRATLKGITLTLLENPENYDFEIKDPESERPLNWQYYCGETDSGSYSLKYAANDGVNGSGALR